MWFPFPCFYCIFQKTILISRQFKMWKSSIFPNPIHKLQIFFSSITEYNWTEVERHDSSDLQLRLCHMQPYTRYYKEAITLTFKAYKAIFFVSGMRFWSKRWMTTALVRLRESQLAQKVMVKIKNYSIRIQTSMWMLWWWDDIDDDGKKDRLDIMIRISILAHEIKCWLFSVPTRAPTNVRCRPLGPTSLKIEWDTLKEEELRGPLVKYNIYYQHTTRNWDNSGTFITLLNPYLTEKMKWNY